MYYESRIHERKQFETVAAMVKAMKAHEVMAYHALEVPSLGLMVVADQPDDFGEAAIIKVESEKLMQIESLTLAWIEPKQWEKEIISCLENPCSMREAKVQFAGSVDASAKAWFTCGCCGNGFKGVVAEQLKYDQDNGFGICVKCEKYYK